MKRFALALLLFVPAVAFAFDPATPTPRVGVLRQSLDDGPNSMVADAVARYLTDELRERGLDAFDARVTYDEALEQNYAEADYLVEIAADAGGNELGGLGVGGRHGGVGVSVLVARVAAVVRVYDGRTFQRIASESLHRRNTAVLPTSASIGGRGAWIGVAIPFVQAFQFRNVAKAAAREAASRVVSTLAAP